MNRKEEMMRMYVEDKMTYAQIGEHFGVSKQRVFHLIGGASKYRHRPITKEMCVYDGIRKWMNENKVSLTAFIRLLYGDMHPRHYQGIKNMLKGTDCRKHFIDKVLGVTKLTYEEAFSRGDEK